MAAYNHWQMCTFQDLLDLTKAPDVLLDMTKASDVLQCLSPGPTSSSNVQQSFDEMVTEVCQDEHDNEALNFHRLSSEDLSSTSYSKASTVYSKGSSSRSPTRVRWADEKKIVSVYARGSSSPTRVQCADAKKSLSVRSSHEHEARKHIHLARTAAGQVSNVSPCVPKPQTCNYVIF